ncbi:tyrosine-type recombinase/integrase [Roseomonas gilardii]|uniref:Tyrosine-type recombinase/integrase n=1 Tax=Roseomonas gilardii TaxID=257708 RepID=A0ABU3MLJ2_9PROT|nr:tyrosine-type recombinase/integrase [Roseomonas gilardii]MDT8333363.1 tyrosine-type recombinase/integrase [Roseomonas gilardii]
MAKLTALGVKNAKPGRHSAGDGLILDVRESGRAYWTLRYQRDGKRRDMGLGPARGDGALTLAEARAEAAKHRSGLKGLAGQDPIEIRKARKAAQLAEAAAAEAARAGARTFREMATLYIGKAEKEWKNAKHRQQWSNTLESYAYPLIGSIPVADVSIDDLQRVLEPIWRTKPETGARVKMRLLTVLDYAQAEEIRPLTAPGRAALAAVLKKRLGGQKQARREADYGHHAALPWQEVGSFMKALEARDGIASRCLAFTILTAARSGEARGATWAEIDMEAAVWTIPGERMKGGREHRVPLSDAAMEILRGMEVAKKGPASFVFPGNRQGRPLSDMALTAVLRRMKRSDTVHGFRSTFRDWCGDATSYPREVAEAALAHALRDKVEAAYRRSTALERRRALMAEWAGQCGRLPAEVVTLRGQDAQGAEHAA